MNRKTQYAAADTLPEFNTGVIRIHHDKDWDGMRAAGKLAAETLDMITPHVQPGVTTSHLNQLCHEFISDHHAVPAALNYKGFPKSICTSINNVVCHGIPNDKPLKEKDILNIDVTVILDSWHGDTSRMFVAGNTNIKAQRLINVTYNSLIKGIEIVKPGITTGDIGHAIQTYAESFRYSVVKDFCGHGLGRIFHDAPNILHYGTPGSGDVLKEGMFFTIEPMINIGKHTVKYKSDGWTAVTRDNTLSAQFEHSIGVTATGYEIFTLSPKNLKKPLFNT